MIYLDHTATTQPYPEVADCLIRDFRTAFYNPAAAYRPAIALERQTKTALEQIAQTLGCRADDLTVTSGATESINTVLKSIGLSAHPRQAELVISQGEHAATLMAAQWLEQAGFARVHRVGLMPDGRVDLAALADVLTPDTQLISVVSVNNQTGAYTDPEAVVRLRDAHAPRAKVHIDHVQAWNKVPVHLVKSGVDFASFSGHKIHGPKGIGLLYARKNLKWTPWAHGGGQQDGRRSGTENPVAVCALAEAARIGYRDLDSRLTRVRVLRQRLIEALAERAVPVHIHAADTAIPHILSVSVPGVRGETLLHMLEAEDILVSTGSACSSHRRGHGDHVFEAMGVSRVLAEGSLRISLDASNTEAEMVTVADALQRASAQLLRTAKR